MNGRDSDSKALLAIQYCDKLSPKKRQTLYGAAGTPSELFSYENKRRFEALAGDNAAEIRKFYEEADAVLDGLKKAGVNAVSILDDEYPALLREIDCPPLVLFAKGNVSLLDTFCLAIVGTRRPTRYGAKLADEFSREFARAGITVVSGFARGIDSTAHKACVESGAPTIAVFGCGVDVCYPAENRGLHDAILSSGGLLVSEYGLGVKPAQFRFPDRNRIISGLCRGVFLPEAARKSGSLITVNLALEQGRDVFVAPGNVYSQESEGCNLLLKSMPHALTLSPEDVLDFYRITSSSAKKEPVQLSIAETAVTETLHEGEKHFEELLEETGLSASELSTVLVNLELAGVLEQTTGNYYSLC